MRTTALLLLAASTLATPSVVHPRTSHHVRISTTTISKITEANPTTANGNNGWGEAAHNPGSTTPDAAASLVAFHIDPRYSGHTCHLHFSGNDADTIAEGENLLRVFEFVASAGETFDAATATWAHKGGYKNRELATFKLGGKSLIYSGACPDNGGWLNYEVIAAGGASSIKWLQSKKNGLWIDVV